MKAIIKIIAIAICAFEIAFGQSSSSEKVSATDISSINVDFGSNGNSSMSIVIGRDSIGNWFVNGEHGYPLGAGVAKFSPTGQLMWKMNFPDSTTETIRHQMLYNPTDNSVIVATESDTAKPVVEKLGGDDGHLIWQIKMSAAALQIWENSIVVLQENGSTGNIVILNNSDGAVKNSFSINWYLDSYPMIQVLGDTVWIFANTSFGKYSLPSGQLLWKVSTTGFAKLAVSTYGTLDTHGNSYIGTSDFGNEEQTNGRDGQLFSVAEYTSDGKKVWSNEWLGWLDTSLAGGVSKYNLNNWTNGIVLDQSSNVLAVFGGVQKYGTAGYDGNNQSAYLMFLNAQNGDTLGSSKWDDGSSSVLANWEDGYFDSENHLVLLGSAGLGNSISDMTAQESFITVFDVNIVDAVAKPINQPKTFRFRLDQNYPNPFNPSTNISFTLGASSNVRLEVYNLLGQKVVTVVNGFLFAGNHSYRFDASKLASGVYIYRLEAGSFTKTMKMVLMK